MPEKHHHNQQVKVLGKERTTRDHREDPTGRLRQTRKLAAMAMMAAGIAHDLGNMLFSVVGFAEMLDEDLPEGSPLQERVDDLLQAVRHAQELVRLMPSPSSYLDERPKTIQVQYMVREIAKFMRVTMPAAIVVTQRITVDCAPVKANPASIYQLITDLATDAVHAMKKSGGTLSITLEEVAGQRPASLFPGSTSGAYIMLCISDTGDNAGEGSRVEPLAFDATIRHNGKGVGMGKGDLMSRSTGALHIRNVPGRGTERRIYLPVDLTEG